MSQFEDLMRRKEEVNQEQKPLMARLEELRAQLKAHGDRKQEISVSDASK
jgi:hypothetical protein